MTTLESTVKDPKKIWTDCPACARKHLAAAYAWLTDEHIEDRPFQAYEVFLARAIILAFEARTGYAGNQTLACGCLAVVEHHIDVPVAVRDEAREVRRMFDAGEFDGAVEKLRALLRDTRPVVFAVANILEASRELPALRTEFDLPHEVDLRDDLPGTLVDAIRWVETTYELGPKS